MKCFLGKIAAKSVVFASVMVSLALATTSCQDETFGFTEGEVSVARYSREFINEFGQPADGHQWGFDAAQAAMDAADRVADTRGGVNGNHVWKYEMIIENTENLHTYELYGSPAKITKKEHEEVAAWFRNHKVYWAETPTYLTAEDVAAGVRTNAIEDKEGYLFPEGTGYAYLLDSSFPGYGSLTKYENSLNEDYKIQGNSLTFYNGWIQHVSFDELGDDIAQNNDTVTGQCMNHLSFLSLGETSSRSHLYDFNAGSGYGWANQDTNLGILVLESDFNVCVYGCSRGSNFDHDKYYIVYLQGDDYAGYYLGMDLESYGSNSNEIIPADGICDDWIIKITDVGNTSYNPARIMCEDLGGSFDTDFNDVVFDVSYKNRVCEITAQAVGGTKEVEIWFGDRYTGKDSNGNKSFALSKTLEGDTVTELHAIFGEDVNTPINVRAINGAICEQRPSWRIGYNGESNGCDVTCPNSFTLADINIYVKEQDAAEWVNISNLEKSCHVPLRICVPQGTDWCRELKSIKKGYTSFLDWVTDPTKTFWTGSKNSDFIYH